MNDGSQYLDLGQIGQDRGGSAPEAQALLEP
jgi:hypothetical protein